MNDFSQLKKLADKLLSETNLIEELKNFGEVEITVSYKYDLMTKPDIDIHIYNNAELDTAKN
ncbi:hypothetical protein IPJ91_03135 [bacterium]|nr:MAG: hypothetical protein IPJ91_03135 [bacterium]